MGADLHRRLDSLCICLAGMTLALVLLLAAAQESSPLARGSAIFAANAMPLRDVVVGGRRVVTEGRHVARDSVRTRFAGVMRRLLAAE